MKTVNELKKEMVEEMFKLLEHQIKKTMSKGHTYLHLQGFKPAVEVYEDEIQDAGFKVLKNGGGAPYAIVWGDEK